MATAPTLSTPLWDSNSGGLGVGLTRTLDPGLLLGSRPGTLPGGEVPTQPTPIDPFGPPPRVGLHLTNEEDPSGVGGTWIGASIQKIH